MEKLAENDLNYFYLHHVVIVVTAITTISLPPVVLAVCTVLIKAYFCVSRELVVCTMSYICISRVLVVCILNLFCIRRDLVVCSMKYICYFKTSTILFVGT